MLPNDLYPDFYNRLRAALGSPAAPVKPVTGPTCCTGDGLSCRVVRAESSSAVVRVCLTHSPRLIPNAKEAR